MGIVAKIVAVVVGIMGIISLSTRLATKRKTSNENDLYSQHNAALEKRKLLNSKSKKEGMPKAIPHNTFVSAPQASVGAQPAILLDEPIGLIRPAFKSTFEQSKKEDTRPVCVLVLEGGGLRGVFTCQILAELEDQLRKINKNEDFKLSSAFDLIVGTSTGGLISLGLGRLGWDVATCMKLYYTMAKEVFGGRETESSSWFNSIYDSTLSVWHKIKSVVTNLPKKTISMYSSSKFSDVLIKELKDPDAPLSSKKLPLVATVATDVSWPEGSYPAILRSYSIHNQNLTKLRIFPNVTISKAAMATSAATFYFDPVSVVDKEKEKEYKLVDGGLNSNDPVLIAWCEAQALWPKRKVFMVSVGTGVVKIDSSNSSKGGYAFIICFIFNLFQSLFSAKEATTSMCISVLAQLDILDRVRLNTEIDIKKSAMDDSSSMKYWREVASDYVQDPDNNDRLRDVATIITQCQKFNILNEANL